MNEICFSVTEVVTATRCPRQLVLARGGHRVVPYGPDAFGTAAHVALAAIARGAADDRALHAALDAALPDRSAVERALFRLGLGPAHAHAKRVASSVDGSDLGRFADTVKRIAALLTPGLAKAAATAGGGRNAVARVFVAAEEDVALELDDVTVRGRVDLVYRDAHETWVWDLKTYAESDHAQREQVRLYAMAYAAKGVSVVPALVHVAQDRIEIGRAEPPRPGDAEKVRTLARHMRSWLDGAPPPSALDLGTCRRCPAQSACWRTWGRTLPDENDAVGGRTAATTPPPKDAKASAVAPEAVDRPPLLLGVRPGKPPARTEPVRVDPSELVRHVAVFGAAGSGKTVLAKRIVEEAVLAGVPVIAFDVQGDILQLAKPLDDAEIDPALRARRDSYRQRADVRLLTPMSDAGLRISLNPLKFPSRDMPEEQATVYAEAVAENLLAHVKLPASWRSHASAYLAERVRAAMRKVDALLIEDLIAGIVADEDVDDPLLERTQRAKLARELRLLTVGSKSYLFRVGRPLDFDRLVTSDDPTKTPLNVIWLNGLGDQQNKASFVAMALADLYGWMLRQRSGAPRVLLYFDELGPYMPPNGEPPSKRLLKQIFKEGRKYGVCGLLATQNFTDVDYKVVSQASTVAIGRLNAVQEKKKAVDALGSPAGFDVHAAVDALIGSPPGRFVVKRVEGAPHWLDVRGLLTFHRGTWGEEEIRAHTSEPARAAWNATGAPPPEVAR